MAQVFKQKLTERYSTLSAKLKEAADFVDAKPVDVATRSLRSISSDAGVTPATFTRMAKALGYDSYELLREEMRNAVGKKSGVLSGNLARLRKSHDQEKHAFFSEHISASMENISALGMNINPDNIRQVVSRLHKSRRVLVSGALGSTGIAEYMAYTANFITDNWKLAGRSGSSVGGDVIDMGEKDTLIIITNPPYANKSIQLAEIAKRQGVFTTVITDSHKCPALKHASANFIVPTASPHFFSSYVSIMALVEVLVGMLATQADETALERIAKVEETNRIFEYLAED